MKDKINLLIEDYKRRLNTINDLLKQPTPKKMMESENLYWERIRTKGSEYRTFIAELEKIDIPPSEAKKEIKDIIDCVLKFDTTGLSSNAVANYFEVIQRDLKKEIKPPIEGEDKKPVKKQSRMSDLDYDPFNHWMR